MGRKKWMMSYCDKVVFNFFLKIAPNVGLTVHTNTRLICTEVPPLTKLFFNFSSNAIEHLLVQTNKLKYILVFNSKSSTKKNINAN